MCRVRGLLEAEAHLRRQISDLEKKEAVYSKTIQVRGVREREEVKGYGRGRGSREAVGLGS